MEITDVRVLQLAGSSGEAPDGQPFRANFVHILAGESASGLFGPVRDGTAQIVLEGLRPHLMGEDPMATEAVGHRLREKERHAGGLWHLAMGAVDCALWDLRGRVFGAPIYRLLGGPVRRRVPAYASMLGYDPESEAGREAALLGVREGFESQKWALRDGPAEGWDGMRRNLRRLEILRELLGRDYPLMVDALGRWDTHYAMELCRRARPLHLHWLEEPLPPEATAQLASLRSRCGVPIASGERWHLRDVVGAALREGAVDILQTDVGWSGISEVQRISALAAHFGAPIYPHGAGWLPGLQVSAAQPPEVFRAIEYHVSLARERTYFLKDPPVPRGGAFDLPAGVGLGLEIDASKVAHQRVLTERWAAPSARGEAP